MNIVAQPAATKAPEMTFYPVCFLQAPSEQAEMAGLLEDYPADSLTLDLIISEWDYTHEQHPEPETIGEIWLPSFRDYTETLTYVIFRDRFDNFAVYRKAWL